MWTMGAVLVACLGLSGLNFASPQTNESGRGVAARRVKDAKPKYPEEAFNKGIEGTVLVEFVIDTEGRVQKPRVVKSVPGLDQAAIDTVLQWRFVPAEMDGKAVATKVQTPVAFCIWGKGCVGPAPKPKRK